MESGDIKTYPNSVEADHGDFHRNKIGDPYSGEVHLNLVNFADGELLNTLIHEARHAMGEEHLDSDLFPDEEQVNSECSGTCQRI